MDECPTCGDVTGALIIKVNFVKIATHRCKCGRVWRNISMTKPFLHHDVADEIRRLNCKHPGKKEHHIQLALDYLQAKLDDHTRSALSRDAALRKRRNDVWEKRFLKEALDEVF